MSQFKVPVWFEVKADDADEAKATVVGAVANADATEGVEFFNDGVVDEDEIELLEEDEEVEGDEETGDDDGKVDDGTGEDEV